MPPVWRRRRASLIARSPGRRLLGLDGLTMLGEISADVADADGLALQRDVAGLASELGEWSYALERWASLAGRLADPWERADGALAAVLAAVRLERPEEVYAFAARARELAPDSPLVAIEADVREGQALRWLENRTAEAQARTDRAAGAARRLVEQAGGLDALGDAERRAFLAAMRAQVDAAIRAGDPEASRGDWAAAVSGIAEQIGAEADPHYRLNVRMMHLPLVARFGSPGPQDVQPLLDAMATDAAVAGCERCRWQSILFGAEALARVGPVDAARAALDAWDRQRPGRTAGSGRSPCLHRGTRRSAT